MFWNREVRRKNIMKAKRKMVKQECFGDWHLLRRWETAWKLRLKYKLEEGRGSD